MKKRAASNCRDRVGMGVYLPREEMRKPYSGEEVCVVVTTILVVALT